MALSVLVMLVVLEFASRLIVPQDLSDPWMTVDNQGLVLNRAGAMATHRRGETVATYRINENHMRDQAPHPDIPSVLVVGDSFTFGWLVDSKNTVVSQLQKQADAALGPNKIRFLNAGTGGWGTASYLDYLTRYADDIRPAAILVFANATDFNRSIQSGIYDVTNDARAIRLSAPEITLPATIKRFVTGLSVYQWLVGNSNLMQMFRLAVLGAISSASEAAAPGAELLDNNQTGIPEKDIREFNISLLRELRSVADQQSVPIFISTQYHWQYTPDVYDWLVPVMKELDIPFLATQREIGTTTNNKVDGFFITGDPHPAGAVYKILADKTWSWLAPQLKGHVIEQ